MDMNTLTRCALLPMLAASLFSASAPAQVTNWDFGVVSELLGVATNAIDQIEGDSGLKQDYEAVLVEQEITMEAARRGMAERLDVKKYLDKVRRETLVRALREEIFRAVAEPNAEEIKAGYARGRDTVFSHPPRYMLDAIQLDRKDADAIRKAKVLETGRPVEDSLVLAVKGTPIVTLASRQWVTREFMAPEIWQALPTMKEGEVRVFDVTMGLYLIRRSVFRDKEPVPFEEIKDTVKQMVWAEKRQAAWENLLIETRQRLGLPPAPPVPAANNP